jgi:hypothetical protein
MYLVIGVSPNPLRRPLRRLYPQDGARPRISTYGDRIRPAIFPAVLAVAERAAGLVAAGS